MKQVIVYNQIDSDYHGGQRYENETLFRYFRSQIDWSLSLGWKKDDIIIGTNFSFEYNGVKNYNLTDICTYSGFNNFWYGALELIKNGVLTEYFWLHDQDSWPVRNFEFPIFPGIIAGAEYQGTKQWNCGSIYMKDSVEPILDYIVELMRNNPEAPVSSDEVWIGWCRFDNMSQIKEYMSSINTTYNCGCTHFQKRYDVATKPINVFSFKPDLDRDFNIVKEYLPEEMLNVFKEHKLLK